MKVNIKEFNVDMQVKSSGIEFEVRTPDDSEQLGDCYVTMTGLIWCKGKKNKDNGIKISWNDFITIMASDESIAAAVQAAGRA
jgi:hypothetical protein